MDTLLIVFLTLLNGAFAMSELALASSRKARLAAMAEAGDKGAHTALELLDNPTQFLSSVQVGITSIGMLNGIVGEAAFSDDLGLESIEFVALADKLNAHYGVDLVAFLADMDIDEIMAMSVGRLVDHITARV